MPALFVVLLSFLVLFAVLVLLLLLAVVAGATIVVGATATGFGKSYLGGSVDGILFHATEFQENAGHAMIAYFLLRQADTAARALEGDIADKDKTYYQQKLITARYFAETFLPGAITTLKGMDPANVTGLEAAF